MRIALTGATGFVGSHLLDALVARGDDLRCIVRRAPPASLVASGAAVVLAQLDDVAALGSAVDGVDAVVHVAGLIKARRAAEYWTANVVGTRGVVRACLAARRPPRRLVLISSLAAAGPSRGSSPVYEDDPPRPCSAYGASKLAAEAAVWQANRQIEVVVVRPSVVYGPRDAALRPLFRAVRLGLAPRPAGDPFISLVHVRDLVACIIRAIEVPGAAGRTYFAASPEPARISDLTDLIGEAVGRRPIAVPVAALALVLAGLASDAVAGLTGVDRPFGLQKAREILRAGWVCDVGRAERELGWRAQISHREGLAETLAAIA